MNFAKASDAVRNAFSRYASDLDTLLSHAFTPDEIKEGKLYRQFLDDALSVNEGMMFENSVAQRLVAGATPSGTPVPGTAVPVGLCMSFPVTKHHDCSRMTRLQS